MVMVSLTLGLAMVGVMMVNGVMIFNANNIVMTVVIVVIYTLMIMDIVVIL